MKIQKVLLILAVLMSGFSLSCADDKNSLHIKDWKILHNQKRSLESVYNKRGWLDIKVPSTFKLLYPHTKGFQYVWLKSEFEITGNPSTYHGISLGRIFHNDRVYINKKLIGSRSVEKSNNVNTPRNYKLPENVLRKGKNDIYINLGIFGDNYGGLLDSVIIENEKEFTESELLDKLLYVQLPMGVVFYQTFLMISCIIFIFWDRKEKFFICGFMTCLAQLIYILSLYSPFIPINHNTCISLQMVFPAIIAILGLLMSQATYRVYTPKTNKIMFSIYCLIIILMLIINQQTANTDYYFLIFTFFLFIFCPHYLLLLLFLNSVQKDRFNSYILTILAIIYGSSLTIEYIFHFNGILFPRLIVTYTIPISALVSIVILARDSAKRIITLDLLYEQLKLPEGNGSKLSITDESEKKLQRIIDFIKENFTSDISREGLAAAIGMNPNYMSSLFKEFTGIKINDYINKLRIEDAAIKLKEDKLRIIDIALSVGFESLSTFNRAFKNIMNTTPSQYREQN